MNLLTAPCSSPHNHVYGATVSQMSVPNARIYIICAQCAHICKHLDLFIHLFIYLSIYLFIHLFVYSFIYLLFFFFFFLLCWLVFHLEVSNCF